MRGKVSAEKSMRGTDDGPEDSWTALFADKHKICINMKI